MSTISFTDRRSINSDGWGGRNTPLSNSGWSFSLDPFGITSLRFARSAKINAVSKHILVLLSWPRQGVYVRNPEGCRMFNAFFERTNPGKSQKHLMRSFAGAIGTRTRCQGQFRDNRLSAAPGPAHCASYCGQCSGRLDQEPEPGQRLWQQNSIYRVYLEKRIRGGCSSTLALSFAQRSRRL